MVRGANTDLVAGKAKRTSASTAMIAVHFFLFFGLYAWALALGYETSVIAGCLVLAMAAGTGVMGPRSLEECTQEKGILFDARWQPFLPRWGWDGLLVMIAVAPMVVATVLGDRLASDGLERLLYRAAGLVFFASTLLMIVESLRLWLMPGIFGIRTRRGVAVKLAMTVAAVAAAVIFSPMIDDEGFREFILLLVMSLAMLIPFGSVALVRGPQLRGARASEGWEWA